MNLVYRELGSWSTTSGSMWNTNSVRETGLINYSHKDWSSGSDGVVKNVQGVTSVAYEYTKLKTGSWEFLRPAEYMDCLYTDISWNNC
jgi:hypothetical protein